MSIVIAIAILTCIALAVGVVVMVRRLACPRVELPATLNWIEELSTERYKPMLRLLGEEELSFIRRQPGFTPHMEAQFRRQRCQVFRGYLRSLSSDFNRVSIALKLLMVQASTDRPDLAATLVRTRIAFTFALIAAHFHVVLYCFGLSRFDASQLLHLFNSMRVELRTLVPCEMSAAA